MQKQHAIDLLGGSVSAAAKAINRTPQAISQWPDPLSPGLIDRVHATLYRQEKLNPPQTKEPKHGTDAVNQDF